MPRTPDPFAIDLQRGVVPISKAASSLAALIRLSHTRQLPIVVTQKGSPSAVLIDIDLFAALRERAERAARLALEPPPAEAAPEPPPAPVAEEPSAPVEEPAAPARKGRGGRRAKAAS